MDPEARVIAERLDPETAESLAQSEGKVAGELFTAPGSQPQLRMLASVALVGKLSFLGSASQPRAPSSAREDRILGRGFAIPSTGDLEVPPPPTAAARDEGGVQARARAWLDRFSLGSAREQLGVGNGILEHETVDRAHRARLAELEALVPDDGPASGALASLRARIALILDDARVELQHPDMMRRSSDVVAEELAWLQALSEAEDALASARGGATESARAALEAAAALDPETGAYAELARACGGVGESRLARVVRGRVADGSTAAGRAAWAKVLELDPDQPEALSAYEPEEAPRGFLGLRRRT